MENEKVIESFYAKTRGNWRKWLQKNGQVEKSVPLIIHNKNSKTPSVNYVEAVEEALCFGWIDSKAMKRDEESRFQFFTPRKAKSNWSKSNIERAERMIKEGLMTPQGQQHIDIAKAAGKWDL